MTKCLLVLSLSFTFFFISGSSFSQKVYVTDSESDIVKVVNTTTNTIVDSIIVNNTGGDGVAVSPDGSRVYITYFNDGTNRNIVTVINTADNSVVKDILLNDEAPYSEGVAVSPDGSKLFVSYVDTFFIINTTSLNVAARIPVTSGEQLEGIAVSPDGTRAYAAGSDAVYIFDAVANTLIDTIPVTTLGLYQLIINPNGSTLYATDILNGGLLFFNLADKTVTPYNVGIQLDVSVAVSPDGATLYATNIIDNTVSVVSAATGTVITDIPVGSFPAGISITPDGSKVYAVNLDDATLSAISTSDNTVIATVNIDAACYMLGGFTSSTSVLPVTLLNFTAARLNKDVNLQWQTSAETNTSYFSLERSSDGIRFSPFAKVDVTYSNTAINSYVYTDKNIAGSVNGSTVYYRLQTADKNGSTVTSQVVPVTLDANIALMWLMPNPVKNHLILKLSRYSGVADITIVDIQGKMMLKQHQVLTEGSTVSLNTSSFAAGTYNILVTGKTLHLQKKFIKE